MKRLLFVLVFGLIACGQESARSVSAVTMGEVKTRCFCVVSCPGTLFETRVEYIKSTDCDRLQTAVIERKHSTKNGCPES